MRIQWEAVPVEFHQLQPCRPGPRVRAVHALPHQVPNFPDPNRDGGFPKSRLTRLAAGNPQFQVAQGACQHLLPNQVEAGPTHAQVQQALSGMVRFAACIRSRGARNWPDPTVDRSYPSDPRPVFDLHNRVDPTAPGIAADIQDCRHLMPQNVTPHMCGRALAPAGSQPGDEGMHGRVCERAVGRELSCPARRRLSRARAHA